VQRSWFPWLLLALAILGAFEAYGPALPGPFVLDDLYNPYGRPDATAGNIRSSNRPALMLSFLINFLVSGQEPYFYHVTNVAIHIAVCAVVFLILRRWLRIQGESSQAGTLLAALGAGVMLVHPIHTEAVAYIASRSDLLCTLFAYTALGWHLRRSATPEGVRWLDVVIILAAMTMAVLTKEMAAVLPALLLITDIFVAPAGAWAAIRRNWKLHSVIGAGGVLASLFVGRTLLRSNTAGFNVAGIGPLDYLMTQARVIWSYLLLVVAPVGQNADPDVAISRGAEPAALAGVAALAAITVLAWVFRRRFPLAALGWLLFLVMLAPTSSIVPIRDPMAERRMYFPFLGLLLVFLEAVRRVPFHTLRTGVAGSVLLLALSFLTHSRSAVWGSDLALWRDTAAKSPNKFRARFQLAYALYRANQCEAAAAEFALTSRLGPPDISLLVDWAHSLDCAGRGPEAAERIRAALAIDKNAHLYATLGMIEGKQGRYEEALIALDHAEKRNSLFPQTYVYRGNVYAAQGQWERAEKEFERALKLAPRDQGAQHGLSLVRRQMGK